MNFTIKYQKPIAIFMIIIGLVTYAVKSFQFANTIPPLVWDEGMYMYNGYLFMSGKYIPYQDYGPWTNQLPFAYLMGGIPQVLFGPGMRAGRYFNVFLGLASLLGLALAANRLRGYWWAAAVIWIVALNDGWIMAFSQVFSQGMVSFLVAWALFFLVSKQHQTWDLVVSAVLFGLAGMVRVNVLPLMFLMVLYAFWQKGFKHGLIILGAGITPILISHLLYWPNILKFWAYWIPLDLFPMGADYLSPWREIFLPEGFSWWPISAWWGAPTHLAWEGLNKLLDSLRANLLSWFGIVVAITFFPWKERGKLWAEKKLLVFLIGSYVVMFTVHIWAALGGKTCRFSCLPGYFLFFNWLGLLALVASSRYWQKEIKLRSYLVVIFLVLLTFVVFEYRMESAFRAERTYIVSEILGVDERILKKEIPPPEYPDGSILGFLADKLKIDVVRWARFLWKNELLTKMLWWIIPVCMVAVPYFILRLLSRYRDPKLPMITLHILLLAAFSAVFASNQLFSQPLTVITCDGNIIERQEQVGAHIQSLVEPGSTVFWDVKSTIPLLYNPDIHIYLPQIGARFTLVKQPVTDYATLERFGWWSINQGEEWIQEADYAIVEYRFIDGLWNWEERINDGDYNIISQTDPSLLCVGKPSALVILERIP